MYPLVLLYCRDCTLAQLSYTIPKEIMFLNHPYVSGTTKSLQQHFKKIATEVVKEFDLDKEDLILDIGGNDGTKLKEYKKLKCRVLNVESAKGVAAISERADIPTLNRFFDETIEVGEKVSIIEASGVFFHLEEIHSVIKGINNILKEDGVLVVHFMYAGDMLDTSTFDTIYHEHLCYYTIKSLTNLLKPYKLEIFDASHHDIHGGSIVAKIGKLKQHKKTGRLAELVKKDEKYTLKAYQKFAKEVKKKIKALSLLIRTLAAKDTIYAMGAPAKGNTLLNSLGLTTKEIKKAMEVNFLKIGKFTPLSHIPIVRESKVDRPDFYLLLAHSFANELLEKNWDLRREGVKFIIPFQEPMII